jgi:hypothetical protein
MNTDDIADLFRAAYPERGAARASVRQVLGFWRAEATDGTLVLSHPGATADAAAESLAAELVRVKRARCDDGPHRLDATARETLEDAGLDPRAVLDEAAAGYDRGERYHLVVRLTAPARIAEGATIPAMAEVEIITLAPTRYRDGATQWVCWDVRA